MILLALSAQPTMTQNGRLASLFVCLPPRKKKHTNELHVLILQLMVIA